MKNLLLICLFIVGVTSAQAQISTVGSTHAAANNGAANWSVQLSPQTGDTLLVGCDYAVGIQLAGVSDSNGDSFSPVGPEADSAFAARAFIATNVHGGSTTVSCNANSGSDTNEIYVTELKGVNPGVPVDSYASLSGSTSSAKGTITSAHPNELVWAYIVTGHASDPSGWTKLSTYDGNLVADHAQASPGTLSASFPVTMGWTLVLVALEPAGTSGSGSSSSGSSGSGSSGSGGGSAAISVSVTPTTASVQVSQSSPFSASLQNDSQNQGVNWTLSGSGCSGATCGALTNVTTTSATYVAPASVPSPATVSLTATSVADSTKSASAAITVTAAPVISVSVTPSSASVQISQSAPFSASLKNDSQNKGVSWSLSGSGCSGATCGTLTNATTTSVTYVAPAAVPSPATVTLKATSVADSTKSASSTITVTTAPAISVAVTPSSAAVQVSQTAGFSATLQNDSQNKGVTWSLTGSGCSGSTCGTLTNVTATSVTYNAPATVPSPASVTLTATSVADTTKSSSSSISITNPSNDPPGGPTLVWSKSAANTTGLSVNGYISNLPTSGTLSGNVVLATFQYAVGSGATASLKDDKGDAFALLASNSNSNQTVATYCGTPTPGARVLTLTFSGGTPAYVAMINASEWYNLSCSPDGSSTNSSSSSAVSAGSFSTTSDGDLIYQAAEEDGNTGTERWTAGASPWSLLSASSGLSGANTPQAAQFQVQASHASINPTLSMSTADSWNSVAVALKATSSGTAPAPGIRILHLQEEAIPAGLSGPITVQFPSSGNLLVSATIDSPNFDVTGITDSNSNSHVQIGSPLGNADSGDVQTFYAANAATSNSLSLTFKMTGSPTGGSDFFLYDVTGASSAPFDSAAGRQTASGQQGSSGTVAGPSINPSVANGLVIAQIAVSTNSIVGVSPGYFAGSIPNPLGQTNPTNENNGWAFDFPATTGSRQYMWLTQGGDVWNWASTVISFLPQ